MKKILISIVAILGIFASQSCSDMLETESDNMVIDPALNNKTDSVFYALGIAQAMQQLADQYFFVGEMRGELVATTNYTNTNLRQLSNYSAASTNAYDSAYVYYKVINNCNYYLTHRDTTLYTGAQNVTINEYAAVEAFRAWAYLQLVRTYGDGPDGTGIPFFTHPLTAISEIENEANFPKKKLADIVAELAPRLEKFSGLAVPYLHTSANSALNIGTPNWSNTQKAFTPSRVFIPVDIVLGELYLENAQYTEAAQHYCKYLCDNKIVSQLISDVKLPAYFQEPEDFAAQYNAFMGNYPSIFQSTAAPMDVITYIPMAVSSQNGKTTNVPLAFGHDYYSTDASRNCPRVENVQLQPSKDFHLLTDSTDFYYYPENYGTGSTLLSYPNDVKSMRIGDGRASYSDGNSSGYVINRDPNDTTRVYIMKPVSANIILYRASTLYLHLAEAFNRMGYPDAAFAILRNGISTYLEDITNEPVPVYVADPATGEQVLTGYNDAPEYCYMNKKTIDMLSTTVPFFSAENRETFAPEEVYGIHQHGAGAINYASNKIGTGLEDGVTVVGSRATAVGSQCNLLYLPKPIIGAKLAEIAKNYGVAVGTSKADSIAAMEDILCDEYAREFAFEGVRFYDLQRMARHYNESGIWGGNFGSLWFSRKLQNNNPSKSLMDPKNWYLPFN